MEEPDFRIVTLEIVIHNGAKPGGHPDAYDARAVKQALARDTPAIYYITAGLHSPETGPPVVGSS